MQTRNSTHSKIWRQIAISLIAAVGGTAFGLAAMSYIVSGFAAESSRKFSRTMDRLSALERRPDVGMSLPVFIAKRSETDMESKIDDHMRPGWIARVLVPPTDPPFELPKSDIGAFVLDEIRFNLLSHEGHGIYQPRSAAYRLTAIYRAEAKGCYQFGIEARMRRFEENSALQTRICKFRIYVGTKEIVHKTIKLSPGRPQQFVAGLIDLEAGLHPIDIEVFCDLGPNQTGEDVILSITTREPGSSTFVARRDAFMHNVLSEFGPIPLARAEESVSPQ